MKTKHYFGDHYQSVGDDTAYILALIDTNRIALISLRDGNRYCDPIDVLSDEMAVDFTPLGCFPASQLEATVRESKMYILDITLRALLKDSAEEWTCISDPKVTPDYLDGSERVSDTNREVISLIVDRVLDIAPNILDQTHTDDRDALEQAIAKAYMNGLVDLDNLYKSDSIDLIEMIFKILKY